MVIVRDKAVRFGKPVIKGTRITIGDVAETFYGLERSVSTIASDFGLDEHEVEEAIRHHHELILDKVEDTPTH